MIINENEEQVKELLVLKCKNIQDNIDKQIKNLKSTEDILGVAIVFINNMS